MAFHSMVTAAFRLPLDSLAGVGCWGTILGPDEVLGTIVGLQDWKDIPHEGPLVVVGIDRTVNQMGRSTLPSDPTKSNIMAFSGCLDLGMNLISGLASFTEVAM